MSEAVQLRCVVPFEGYRKNERFARSSSEAARLERRGVAARVVVPPVAAPVAPVFASTGPTARQLLDEGATAESLLGNSGSIAPVVPPVVEE